jgi:hypothetical protein
MPNTVCPAGGGGGGPDPKYKKKFDLIKKYNLNNFFKYVSIFDSTVNFGDTKVFSYFTTKNLYLKENLDIVGENKKETFDFSEYCIDTSDVSNDTYVNETLNVNHPDSSGYVYFHFFDPPAEGMVYNFNWTITGKDINNNVITETKGSGGMAQDPPFEISKSTNQYKSITKITIQNGKYAHIKFFAFFECNIESKHFGNIIEVNKPFVFKLPESPDKGSEIEVRIKSDNANFSGFFTTSPTSFMGSYSNPTTYQLKFIDTGNNVNAIIFKGATDSNNVAYFNLVFDGNNYFYQNNILNFQLMEDLFM